MDTLNALENLGYKRSSDEDTADNIDSFIDYALMDLYKRHSIRQIECMLPITYHAIRVHLKSLGVPLRSQGGPNNYRHGRYVKIREDKKNAINGTKNSTANRTKECQDCIHR
jgi:hypothetical protein